MLERSPARIRRRRQQDRRVSRFLRTLALGFVLWLPACAFAAPVAGYWWNPAQGGGGFAIEVQGTGMYFAGFLYAAGGGATWVESNGPMSSPTQYSGALLSYNGGQTLTGAYRAPVVAPSLGTVTINFS